MNSKYMGNSYEARDEKRKALKKEMEETKLINVLIKCKKDLLLLDREEVLEEIESKKEKLLNVEENIKDLKAELIEIDNSLKEHQKVGALK